LNTALVTGGVERVHAVAFALTREGFDAFVREAPISATPGGPSPGSFDCYVQLPSTAVGRSDLDVDTGDVGRLVRRVDTMARALPLLAPEAAIVLVADEDGWDNDRSRTLHALAGAAVRRQAGAGVRVAVVDTGEAGQIAAAARRELGHARAVSLADVAPDMAYADWREEVLNLTSSAETTYFGWRRHDGVRRAAVLRHAVLSPLLVGDGTDRELARAVLFDAVGAGGDPELEVWADKLTDEFLVDVVSPLATDHFELPIHEVAAWVVGHSLPALLD
jgi:hypothetical protein